MTRRTGVFPRTPSTPATMAIKKEPASADNSPRVETPPEVPGGTLVENFVINLGFRLDRTPNSTAQVSALASAKEPTKPAASIVGRFELRSAIPAIMSVIPPCPIVCQMFLAPAFSSLTPLAAFVFNLNLVRRFEETKNDSNTTYPVQPT